MLVLVVDPAGVVDRQASRDLLAGEPTVAIPAGRRNGVAQLGQRPGLKDASTVVGDAEINRQYSAVVVEPVPDTVPARGRDRDRSATRVRREGTTSASIVAGADDEAIAASTRCRGVSGGVEAAIEHKVSAEVSGVVIDRGREVEPPIGRCPRAG